MLVNSTMYSKSVGEIKGFVVVRVRISLKTAKRRTKPQICRPITKQPTNFKYKFYTMHGNVLTTQSKNENL